MKKQDKQNLEYAKQLLSISVDESGELTDERVGGVLQALGKNPPHNHLAVLQSYLGLVKREVSKSKAIVSHAGTISQSAIDAIQTQMSRKYGRKITVETVEDASLIAGIRVRVDCDVYETSVASTLESLQSSL
tara:strand:- start:326 stop:724 length:399 start_codon:yes stop_codon:yes gene_type:complete